MRRLDRYLISEVLGPLGLGLLVYTFILLIRFFFVSAEMIIRRGLPARTVAEMLLLSLPNIVVLTIPMSLLFGVLIAVGRLSADSEMIAMRACGISLYSIVRPMLVLGAVIAAATAYVSLELMPAAAHATQRLMIEIATRTVSQQVEPRIVYYEFQGKALYVFDIDPTDKRWKGVFLADSVPGIRNEVVVAEWGQPRLAPDGEQLTLHLEGATKHSVDLANPSRYEVSRYRTLDLLLQDRFTSDQRAKLAASKNRQAMTPRELRRRALDSDIPVEERRLAEVELHKRYAIPVACVVFALLAVPLGFNNRRGGKSSGFALSIAVILVYWILITQGEEAARVGTLSPSLAIWLPNLLLGALGLFLLQRKDRDRATLPAGLERWIQPAIWWHRFRRLTWRLRRTPGHSPAPRSLPRAVPEAVTPRRPASAKTRRGSIVVRLPRLKIRFPNLLDRYVLISLAKVFLLVMLSAIALSMIADFTDNLDEILKNRPPSDVVVGYFKFRSFQIAYETAPIVVLVTTLIVFSLFGRTNEVTAIKALGTSLFRLAIPAVVAASLVAAGSFLLEMEVLAASNQRVAQYLNRIKGRQVSRAARRADQHWVVGEGGLLYNYSAFDPGTGRLQRLQVIRFDEERHMTARLLAATAQHTEAGWVVEDGWTREGTDFTTFREFRGPVKVDMPQSPEYFAAERPRPEELSFSDLREAIRDLRSSGQSVASLEVALHRKLAFPISSVVMALVALPFAFRLGRQGALYGLGLSVALGIAFFAVYALFMTLGQVGAFAPSIAVWSPSVLFGLFSAYLFLGVRS